MTWRRKRGEVPPAVVAEPTRDAHAVAAIEQAKLAEARAKKDLDEMQKLAQAIRREREKNHFGAAIYNAMRRS